MKTTTTILMLIILFNACKKYPENTLVFKNPEKAFKGGKITSWTADGTDSLPMWDKLYNTPPFNGFYNSYDFRSLQFDYDRKEHNFNCYLGFGDIFFENNKKEVNISLGMRRLYGYHIDSVHNIFLTNKSTWKILKLTKDGTMRIQRNYNSKTYEIQFN